MATFFGFNAPFLGGNQRVLSRQVDERLIKNDLLQLLLTSPGERVMRPEFGGPIRRYVFNPMDGAGVTALRSRIKDIIAEYEPRVEVSDVVIDTDDDNNLMLIKVYGSFNLDIYKNNQRPPASLLVELNIPTKKSTPLG